MVDVAKMLLGPLAGGTFYDSPIAQFAGIKDPEEERQAKRKAEAEAKADRADRITRGDTSGMKRGGRVKKMAKGGTVKSSASKRADGIATKGKTKGRFV